MIRKASFLLVALALVWLAIPASATGTCTAQCNDLTMFIGPAPDGPSDCFPYGTRVCADHGGLRGLLYQP
jgi:hypothetical protein